MGKGRNRWAGAINLTFDLYWWSPRGMLGAREWMKN